LWPVACQRSLITSRQDDPENRQRDHLQGLAALTATFRSYC
jgi:hypothetical protein